MGYLASGSHDLILLFYAIVITVLGDFAGNVLNNYSDWELDEVNNKRTYLHQRLNRKVILFIFLVLSVAYFVLSLFSNIFLLFTVMGGYFTIVCYSSVLRIKDKFFFNNLTLGFAYGLISFSIGYFVSSDNVARFFDILWIPLYCMMLIFCLSIVKDYEDELGDKKHNVKTFVTLFGKKKTVFFQLISVSLIVFITVMLNIVANYLILLSFLPYILFLGLIVRLNQARIKEEYKKIHSDTRFVNIVFILIMIPFLLT